MIWSEELYRIAGRDPKLSPVSYTDHGTLYSPESWSRLQTVVNEALKSGTPYSTELELVRPDGSKRWVVANGEAQHDSRGVVIGLRGIVQDITERKRTEDALEAERRMLERIVQGATLTEILEAVARDVEAQSTDGMMCSILLFDEPGQKLRHGAAPSLPDAYNEAINGVQIGPSVGSCGTAAFRREPVFVYDIANDPLWADYKHLATVHGLGACCSTPMFSSQHKLLGTVAMYYRHPHQPGAHDRKLIESAARLATLAIERKLAQDATGLLAAIVSSSDDAIVSKNLDGIIKTWNTGAEHIFGYSAKEAIGQHITLVIPPDRRAEEDDILARLRRGERIDHFQTVRRRKDGTLLDVSLTISPVRDTSGRIIGASKVARDITAQKRAEKELLESEQRFRVITDASPIMVWMSGTDKLCYYFNKGWLDFVGRTLEQESGNGWAENVHPEDFDHCLQIYVSNFDARRPFEMEYRIRHHTGQYRWILDRAVPRYSADGTFEGYVGGCLDIHYQKEAAEKVRIADETVRLMKIQDEERRRIARELHDSAGQTLTVLGMSLAQLVQRAESVAPELAKGGKEIEGIAQQLSREIRTTSYLLHPPLLDELGLTSALNWYVEGLAQRSGIAIKLEIAANVGRLPSDMELAIFRLVQECLTNIHRHSGSKTADIRMFVKAESLHVEVSDQGKGIPTDRLAEIRSGGSGVGIRGMQERLRQFGGEMNIESNGSGTSVIVTVPVSNVVRATDPEPFQAAV
ncbi:MAG: PAS domain S-box protein [Candidatus Sulfotelmatobacter sp.]